MFRLTENVCFEFFQAKSATVNNHRRELSDLTFESTFSHDSTDQFPEFFFPSFQKNRFEKFDFSSKVQRVSTLIYAELKPFTIA